MSRITIPTLIGFADAETLSTLYGTQVWEMALLLVGEGEIIGRYPWMVRRSDLNLDLADPESLEVNRFHQRHPEGDNYIPGNRPAPLLFREREVFDELAELTRGRLVAYGSNPAFDKARTEIRAAQLGVELSWHYHPVDLVSMSMGWLDGRGLPYPEPQKSHDFSLALGVDPARFARHTALGDCEWTYAWWRAIKGLSS